MAVGRGFKIFVFLLAAVAMATIASVEFGPVITLPPHHLVGLAALIVLGVLSEGLALDIRIGQNQGNSSITFIPLFACVLLFGPAAAVLFFFVGGALTELLVRKKDPWRAAFNVSQYVLSAGAGGFAYAASGGMSSPDVLQFRFLPFVLFGSAFLATNHSLVALGLAVKERLSFLPVLRRLAGPWGTNLLYDLLVSPIAVLVVYFYIKAWTWGLLLVLFPMFFVRHSYFTTLRLQQANRDLLKALVKAIETRDPYTSGHSVRVSSLARDIASLLNVSKRHVDSIETAALLHDIGKIDALYAKILHNPSRLSQEERDVIESHVTKGVDLLKSLSSVTEDVIQAVLHHHEWYDGRGYPDGLVGEAIPLGSRIIMLCDSIDAMLSDRPYRKALSPSDVRQQLMQFSGSQFDPNIVARILRTTLLENHAVVVSERRLESNHIDPMNDFGSWATPAEHPALRRASPDI